jgi:hypothetical protein
MEEQPIQLLEPVQPIQPIQPRAPKKSHKKLILIIVSIAIVLIVAAGVFVAIRFFGNRSDAGISRGVKPDDKFQFSDIAALKGLPQVSGADKLGDGWKMAEQPTATGSAYIYSITQASTSCSILIQSTLIPYADATKKDFALSKTMAESLAATGQGTLGDIYVIQVPSTRGTLQLYTGVYESSVVLTHPDGTQPATTGGSKKADSGTKTYVATRVINQQLGDTSAQKTSDKGVIGVAAQVPAISAQYTCPEKSFDPVQAIKALNALQINLDTTDVPKTSSTGK